MKSIKVPILIIAFNRPEVTRDTFEFIKKAKPEKIYIAVDGHRENVPGEKEKVEEVKNILSDITWKCSVQYKFNESNRGAEITVSSAISWVLEREENVIILEDDIIAPWGFLKFAEEMLIKYQDNEQIATVTGSNFTPIPFPNNEDYCFARYGHSWGWATWRRAWKDFDLNLSVKPEHLRMDFLRTVTVNEREAKFLKKQFLKLMHKGPGNSTWDYTANYFLRVNNKLSIIPRVNLTSNIGIYGLHARGKTQHHFRPYDENFKATKHPSEVAYFREFDQFHFDNYISLKRPLSIRTLKKLKRIIKSIYSGD
ncbi:MAG: nucleotide-diphospho-sugar transferase [Brumimicrobium sp.]|nr:nucleotide-diphospho-sugar transferase [Brumimicrobium sp.]